MTYAINGTWCGVASHDKVLVQLCLMPHDASVGGLTQA